MYTCNIVACYKCLPITDNCPFKISYVAIIIINFQPVWKYGIVIAGKSTGYKSWHITVVLKVLLCNILL